MKKLTLEERGRQIQAKLEAGTRVSTREEMMNTGRRRTKSKRELLVALRYIQRDAGRIIAFDGKF